MYNTDETAKFIRNKLQNLADSIVASHFPNPTAQDHETITDAVFAGAKATIDYYQTAHETSPAIMQTMHENLVLAFKSMEKPHSLKEMYQALITVLNETEAIINSTADANVRWDQVINYLNFRKDTFKQLSFSHADIYDVIDWGYEDELHQMKNNIEKMRDQITRIIQNFS